MEQLSEHREGAGRQRSEISDAVIGVGRRVQQYLRSYEDGRERDTLDCLIYHVERLYCMLLTYENLSSDVLEAVATSLTLLQDIDMSTQSSGYVAAVINEAHHRGRPRLNVNQAQLEYLLELGLTCPRIADALGISLSTVRRRMAEFGLSVTALYSSLSDQEIDSLVLQIKSDFPNCGFRLK